MMDLLLKKSTSGMNAVNKAGRTSLHVAVVKQHPDCVRVLLKYRCDVNVQVTQTDPEGMPASFLSEVYYRVKY